MNLGKYARTFSATSTTTALVVTGHATAAGNGVYITGDSGTTYTNGTYTVKAVSGIWGIYDGSTLVCAESAATARPQGGSWADCSVLEANPVTLSSTAVVLSLVMTGGADGGLVSFIGDGIEQKYSLQPETVAVCDTKQVFQAGTLYLAGTPGTSAQLSYDTISA